ncbi:tetraacyldisaccharide 4'-kinase [Flavobacterium sp. xlx-214]|uniref:tetraacyldisaccharide 4'-kinase n=1 Tax=unclassified Flavobacterium TaxID=196869 RepID=UPI0013D2EC49|nr:MULTISPECIES: tetraacyldisaccharide 4'-kinase [unclassified Flavobacterium]MBA5793749.1 tetraacyldisaccharide 4'-kinase [Flavobacterium sp. xlx-221]QMI83230.1 tetraacyldisaccharide 4'-kinase [Flavobacterium sp. xlx-214]
MKTLRKILFPFSLIYDIVTSIRNFLYDKNILKSTSFNVPIIAVGNLSVGGTGKTPMVEYLIRLLSNNYKIATLSRGYKRKSEGFLLANASTKMEEIGDEPFQYHSKFKNIDVAVDVNRVEGVTEILKLKPETSVVLLDDAFQHRKIKAGFYIMLTAYNDLFYNDLLLPAGNLRESKRGVKRADVVVVTKCPEHLSDNEIQKIKSEIAVDSKRIFFTTIKYDSKITNTISTLSLNEIEDNFIAVAGIAKPEYFYKYLNCSLENCLTFPDHHDFTSKDIALILQKAGNKKMVTTEKDYMRLAPFIAKEQLYYLPIAIDFLQNKDDFNQTVTDFIAQN